jgi:hypothetical protein
MIEVPIDCSLSVELIEYLINNQKKIRESYFIQEKRILRKKYALDKITRDAKVNKVKVLKDIKKYVNE